MSVIDASVDKMTAEVEAGDKEQRTTAPYKPTNEYVLNVAFLSFLGFTTLQLLFAMIARSEAMMADCAAMYVDVMTYLLNFVAERLKHGKVEDRRQLRLRHYFLELIPPSISVVTLIVVTIMALQEAMDTLRKGDEDGEEEPNVDLMLLFSGLNLLLDLVNVHCFARVDVGIHYHHEQGEEATESTPLISMGSDDHIHDDDSCSLGSNDGSSEVNLNMCSAWTHICADTLRSVAVLIAAGIAWLFPNILSPADADSWGAILVSAIILASLVPLIKGLFATAKKIHALLRGEEEYEKTILLNV